MWKVYLLGSGNFLLHRILIWKRITIGSFYLLVEPLHCQNSKLSTIKWSKLVLWWLGKNRFSQVWKKHVFEGQWSCNIPELHNPGWKLLWNPELILVIITAEWLKSLLWIKILVWKIQFNHSFVLKNAFLSSDITYWAFTTQKKIGFRF